MAGDLINTQKYSVSHTEGICSLAGARVEWSSQVESSSIKDVLGCIKDIKETVPSLVV